jgi:hypothetical protein
MRERNEEDGARVGGVGVPLTAPRQIWGRRGSAADLREEKSEGWRVGVLVGGDDLIFIWHKCMWAVNSDPTVKSKVVSNWAFGFMVWTKLRLSCQYWLVFFFIFN